jgi:sirohydrochlorin cobaltochelatase
MDRQPDADQLIDMSAEDETSLALLDERLKAILPEEYQDSYEDVQPISMGSAGLKYGSDGRVAWNDIWATFCDLAMAGGPPHKGMLLEAAPRAEIAARPDRYHDAVQEICRGVTMVTGLTAEPSQTPGWIRVDCASAGMAGWLLRAIVMENIAARCEGSALFLPAGPAFRLEKEIKNVITVIAKTCHYWSGHMWRAQQREIEDFFGNMAATSPLIEPLFAGESSSDRDEAAAGDACAKRIERETSLRRSPARYTGWLGVECDSVRAAVWMMRALVASNILSRREGTTLFVPVNPLTDPGGEVVAQSVIKLQRLQRVSVAR